MQKILNALDKLRMALWWHHIVAPILGVLYLLLLLGQGNVRDIFPVFFWFLLSIIGTASLGYWINDWADQKQDAKVGKTNATTGFSSPQKWSILILLLVLSAFPWIFLPIYLYSIGFWGLLILSFLLYSLPPFRFKERNLFGIICDMLYGHLLPIWITIGTFKDLVNYQSPHPTFLAATLSILLILKGLRNIIQHQIEDRKKDQKLALNTFVHWLGPYRSAMLISVVLMPLELVFLAGLLGYLHWGMFFVFAFFMLTYGIRIWSWKYYRAKSRRQLFRLWFVLNDFYEAGFPLSALVFLIFLHPYYIILALIHLFFFPKTLDHWKWVWKTWINLELWWELRKYIV